MLRTTFDSLMPEEKQYLVENFRLCEQASAGEEVIPLLMMLDHAFLSGYLNKVKEHFGTDKLAVAASQYVKRLGYLMAVPALFTMTVYGKKINAGLGNISLVSKCANGKWMPHLLVRDLSITKPGIEGREEWREALLKELFVNISEVLHGISIVSSVPKSILWENVAIYVFWLYEKRLAEEIPFGSKNDVSGDYDYMIHQAPGSLFGEAENPLRRFFGSKGAPSSTDHIRTRKTCCLYYELDPDGGYCSTCPKNNK
jgi:ferric iron reductase protein FhuF